MDSIVEQIIDRIRESRNKEINKMISVIVESIRQYRNELSSNPMLSDLMNRIRGNNKYSNNFSQIMEASTFEEGLEYLMPMAEGMILDMMS
jgi:hypothetical protein